MSRASEHSHGSLLDNRQVSLTHTEYTVAGYDPNNMYLLVIEYLTETSFDIKLSGRNIIWIKIIWLQCHPIPISPVDWRLLQSPFQIHTFVVVLRISKSHHNLVTHWRSLVCVRKLKFYLTPQIEMKKTKMFWSCKYANESERITLAASEDAYGN